MKNVSVIGSGTMGNGIAHVFAQNGFTVSLIDINPQALQKALDTIGKNLDRQIAKGLITDADKAATLANITTYTDMSEGVANAELVIEAATENIDLKLKIFKQMDELAPVNCILASNTSSISITKLASMTKRPGLVIGMHFMNPVPVMKLVEIINGYSTEEAVTETILDITSKLQKTPALSNDYPGFIANRILMPMINEAIYTLYEGVGGVEEIDTVMKLGMGHPMGPLQLADFIGLDVCLAIMEVKYKGFGNQKYAPCPLLVNMVVAGKLGVKSGEGFYKWNHGTKDLIVSDSFNKSQKTTA
jgi:3-hydroxybutyryl-CoA dehydrogenase